MHGKRLLFLVVVVLTLGAGCGRSEADPINTDSVESDAAVQADASLSIPATSTPVLFLNQNSSTAQEQESTNAVDDSSLATQEEFTDLGNGKLPERLLIPAINLDTSVVELGWSRSQSDDGRIFSQWDVADNAAGWHINSALVGEGGNVVLSGHNNIYGAIFRELDQLKRGDEALLWADGQPYNYTIDKVLIVPEKYATQEQRQGNAAWIGHFEDDRLTLVSCWPRDDNSHRIVVVAYAEDSAAMVDEESGPSN